MINRNIVAFSGTHGTGKSTQAYSMAGRLKADGINVVVIDELARECPLPINQSADELTQYWIISAHMKREIKMMSKYNYIISDRSLLDSVAYAEVLNLLDSSTMEFLANYVKKYYLKIFLLDPTSFNYHVNDGIRDMDVLFRQSVHDTLVKIYNKFDISYTLLKTEQQLAEEYVNIFKRGK